MAKKPPPSPRAARAAAVAPSSMDASHHNHRPQASTSQQAFLLAVLLSSLFSLSLNLYLSTKLGMLKDIKTFETDMMSSFTQERPNPNNVVVSSAEAHGMEAQRGMQQQPVQQQAQAGDVVYANLAVDRGEGHNLAGLTCDKFGGPSKEAADEMVYWEDIPSDNLYVSPFKKTTTKQYLSFEPDEGGWVRILWKKRKKKHRLKVS